MNPYAGCYVKGRGGANGELQGFTDEPGLFLYRINRHLTGKQGEKFVAAKPSHNIRGAETAGQCLCRLPDDTISRLMPERIVYLFKVVEIDDEQSAYFIGRHFLQTCFNV